MCPEMANTSTIVHGELGTAYLTTEFSKRRDYERRTSPFRRVRRAAASPMLV